MSAGQNIMCKRTLTHLLVYLTFESIMWIFNLRVIIRIVKMFLKLKKKCGTQQIFNSNLFSC